MNIYSYQEAFEAADKTSPAMRKAITQWFDAYYGTGSPTGEDPCQRIACTLVGKLVKTVFGEYQVSVQGELEAAAVQALNAQCQKALQLALVGGECYLKPWLEGGVPHFCVIPRNNVLIFGRDPFGEPVDMGTVERSVSDRYYYTLLERRWLDEGGCLHIENRLFRSANSQSLGQETKLSELPQYAHLPRKYRYCVPMGIGLVRVKNPMLNCVDGSFDGVSVYAAAMDLIHRIDENEAQLIEEFRRGESRVIASADMLDDDKTLSHHLFVGLNEDPQTVGITVYSPQLREEAFRNRKKEYLRNLESIVGMKRGSLSDVDTEKKTATEIASSAADYNLTVMSFQKMWEDALTRAVILCRALGQAQGLLCKEGQLPAVDWGNGVLYDEDKTWQDYQAMVSAGLLRPEYALAWRFNLPADNEAQLAAIREKYMPK